MKINFKNLANSKMMLHAKGTIIFIDFFKSRKFSSLFSLYSNQVRIYISASIHFIKISIVCSFVILTKNTSIKMNSVVQILYGNNLPYCCRNILKKLYRQITSYCKILLFSTSWVNGNTTV